MDQLTAHAAEAGLELLRGRGESLELGPFGEPDIWPRPEHSALLTVGVDNAGTPVEVVDRRRLSRISGWLADFLGSSGSGKPGRAKGGKAASALARQALPPELDLIRRLVDVPGVSGAEGDIRQAIQRLLPDWTRRRSSTKTPG